MANEENLIPFTSEQSLEEAVNNGRKGGIASGKARREKKAMRDTLETLLSMSLKEGKIDDVETIQGIAALKGKNITVQEAIMLAQINKAIKGDTKAAEYILDTSGNKPTTVQELSISESGKLADVISQLGSNGLSDDE